MWDGQRVVPPLEGDAGTLRSGGLGSKPAPATWPLGDPPGEGHRSEAARVQLAPSRVMGMCELDCEWGTGNAPVPPI